LVQSIFILGDHPALADFCLIYDVTDLVKSLEKGGFSGELFS